MKKIVELYLHGDDDNFRYDFEQMGMTDEAADNAANWAYEIGFKVEVDTDTGASRVLEINEGDGWRKVEL